MRKQNASPSFPRLVENVETFNCWRRRRWLKLRENDTRACFCERGWSLFPRCPRMSPSSGTGRMSRRVALGVAEQARGQRGSSWCWPVCWSSRAWWMWSVTCWWSSRCSEIENWETRVSECARARAFSPHSLTERWGDVRTWPVFAFKTAEREATEGSKRIPKLHYSATRLRKKSQERVLCERPLRVDDNHSLARDKELLG